MTWLLRICFSLALGGAGWAATLTGRVELLDSRHPAVRKHGDFSGVVVWLEPAAGRAAHVAARRTQMLQKGKRFIPHVLAIQVGTTVDFPNADPIFHNAFSNFAGQPFDVGLYPPGTTRSVTFARAGIVQVFCNIHPTMSAIIAVLPTPYFAVTNASGSFEIDNVPPGDYQLRVFHERAAPERLARLEQHVNIGSGTTAIAPLRISETGYIQTPHKNKYGKEYPPVVEDTPAYGVRK